MKSILIALTALIATITLAEDQTFTIAAGATSVSITNDSLDQRWYLKSVYALQGGATNDTLYLKKVSGSSDVVILGDTIATNETDFAIAVPSTVYLSPSEVCKITCADTNYAVTGFVVTGGTE